MKFNFPYQQINLLRSVFLSSVFIPRFLHFVAVRVVLVVTDRSEYRFDLGRLRRWRFPLQPRRRRAGLHWRRRTLRDRRNFVIRGGRSFESAAAFVGVWFSVRNCGFIALDLIGFGFEIFWFLSFWNCDFFFIIGGEYLRIGRHTPQKWRKQVDFWAHEERERKKKSWGIRKRKGC